MSDEAEIGEALGLCGCGDPEAVMQQFRLLMVNLRDSHKAAWTKDSSYDQLTAERMALLGMDGKSQVPAWAGWLLLYVLDDKGLLEHGTSCRFGWLTPEGEQLLEKLERYLDSEAA